MKRCREQDCRMFDVLVENCNRFCEVCGYAVKVKIPKEKEMKNSCRQEDCWKFNISPEDGARYCTVCGSSLGEDTPKKVCVKIAVYNALVGVREDLMKRENGWVGSSTAKSAVRECVNDLEIRIKKVEEISDSQYEHAQIDMQHS